jgi:hypothetical protein
MLSVTRALVLPMVLAACATGSTDEPTSNDVTPGKPGAGATVPPGQAPAPPAATQPPGGDPPPPPVKPPCTSTIALVAGGATGTFASTWSPSGWSPTQVLGGSTSSAPAVAWDGAGWLAVMQGSGGALVWTRKLATVWSAPAPIGTATTKGAPALVTAGSASHLVYWGSNGKFYHGAFAAGAWDSASDPVGGAASQSFGDSAPTATANGSAFFVAQSGSDSNVYTQQWSANWASASAISGSMYTKTTSSPAILFAGSDLLVVFSHSDNLLLYGRRVGTVWESARALHNETGSSAHSPNRVALAQTSTGDALMVFDGGDGNMYTSRFPSGTPPLSELAPSPWTAPVTLSIPAVASTPSIAAGACGDDAIMAFATSTGTVETMTLSGGTWSAPTAITGIVGASYVSIATRN